MAYFTGFEGSNPPSEDEVEDEEKEADMHFSSVIQAIHDLVPDLEERKEAEKPITSRASLALDKTVEKKKKTFPLSQLVQSETGKI